MVVGSVCVVGKRGGMLGSAAMNGRKDARMCVCVWVMGMGEGGIGDKPFCIRCTSSTPFDISFWSASAFAIISFFLDIAVEIRVGSSVDIVKPTK